jgi:hypothetical protein
MPGSKGTVKHVFKVLVSGQWVKMSRKEEREMANSSRTDGLFNDFSPFRYAACWPKLGKRGSLCYLC